jgi:hypothetical protein
MSMSKHAVLECSEARALMIRVASFALAVISTIAITGCEEGYRVDPAISAESIFAWIFLLFWIFDDSNSNIG